MTTTPGLAATCIASADLGNLGKWCMADATCKANQGSCVAGVCLTVQTGNLGQACNTDGKCNSDLTGLTCTSKLPGYGGSICACSTDASIGGKCDGSGGVCGGNAFDTKFPFIYNKIYATFNGDSQTPLAQNVPDSVTCFNTTCQDAKYLWGNFQKGDCYCYTADQVPTFAKLDDTWVSGFASADKFPTTTIPPPKKG